MKKTNSSIVRWTLPPALALLIACAALSQESDEDDGDEVIKSINDVPAAVREAAIKTCGAEFKKISKERTDGELLYEFEYLKNGVETAALFSDHGVLCEIETAVDASKLPSALIAEIQKRFPGATIARAETTEVHGYEVRVKVGNKLASVEASATGHIAGGKDEEGEEGEEDEEGGEHK